MIELPKELEVIREELAEKYANGMAFPRIDWRNGFNACYDVLEKRGLIRLETELPPTTTARNPSDSECATTRLEDMPACPSCHGPYGEGNCEYCR